MNDCPNVEMRELLPDYAHGAEPADGRVTQHLALCADCSAELHLIRMVIRACPPVRVDLERVSAAIQPYRRPHFVAQRWRIAAAAALIATGGLSVAVMRQDAAMSGDRVATAPSAQVAGGEAGNAAAGGSGSVTSLAMVGGISELSDDQLIALTESVGDLEAMPDAEPTVLVDPIGGQP